MSSHRLGRSGRGKRRGKGRDRGCSPPATAPRCPGRRAGPGGAAEPTAAGARPRRGEGLRLRTQQEPVHVKDEVSDRVQRGPRGGGGGHGEAEQRSAEGAEAEGARAGRPGTGGRISSTLGRAELAGLLVCLVRLLKQSPILFLRLLAEQHFLPGEVVECPSLEIFKNHPDAVLCSGMTLLRQGGWTRRPTVVPSNHKCFVIPKSRLVLLAGDRKVALRLTHSTKSPLRACVDIYRGNIYTRL